MTDIQVITIDGPSGTGKGTVGAYLADWLGWHFLDSGALYRIVAYVAAGMEIALDNEEELAEQAAHLNLRFVNDASEIKVILNENEDISSTIRTEACGNAASQVAVHQRVRQALLDRQRIFRQLPGLVADGRDMGAVVFPQAQLKVFLTASPEKRALRRHNQLKEKGISVNLRHLSTGISERDARDQGRDNSPLMPVPDAVIIDSTKLNIDDVCDMVSELVRAQFLNVPDRIPK